ncbi:hypothetical protein [Leptolyngbya sp. FACHB-8]|nr:hypothetical protein [Leptolyngbya sp. FACHB-8]MBD1909745.1 hypothetical protein [Leptolyngbya sp. FACHB-8]MBD2155734.1 hypothetical protein [Leptolyngbya sp. FACHB-16]
MNELMAQMQAVMETPYYEGKFPCPWSVPECKSFSRIRLSGEMTHLEIGLVLAQLAQYNPIELIPVLYEAAQNESGGGYPLPLSFCAASH